MKNLLLSLGIAMLFISTGFSQSKEDIAKELIRLKENNDPNLMSLTKRLNTSDRSMIIAEFRTMMMSLPNIEDSSSLMNYQISDLISLMNVKLDTTNPTVSKAIDEVCKYSSDMNLEFEKFKTEIYLKSFSEDELKELLKIFNSEIWKKYVESSEIISDEIISKSFENKEKTSQLIMEKIKELKLKN